MNRPNIELGIVNGQIVAYCKTPDFTEQVRNAINNEMFWRDILQRYSVSDLVKQELNSTIPQKVRDEARIIVGSMVQTQLDNYSKINLPAHVSEALSKQLSGFLNDSSRMNQILSEHSNKLNQELASSAATTLARVANEEQYHEVTRAHLGAMTDRFNTVMKDIQTKHTDQLNSQDRLFQQKLESIQKQVTDEIKDLKTANTKLLEQERTITDLQTNLFWTKLITGATFVVGGLVIFLSRK